MGGCYKWPSVPEVMKYRDSVREIILDLISSVQFQLPISQEDPMVCIVDQLSMLYTMRGNNNVFTKYAGYMYTVATCMSHACHMH